MKWLIKLMLVMTLAYSGSVYAERTVQEVAAEARVSSSPVDTTDLKKFAIAQDDASAGLLNDLSQKTLQQPIVKAYARWLGYDPDKADGGGNFLDVFFDNVYATYSLYIAAVLLITGGFYAIWFARMLKGRQEEKERARKMLDFAIIILISGLMIVPTIAMAVFGVFILTMIASLNWMALIFTLYTVSDEADNIEQTYTTNQQLSQWDTGEVPGLWNGMVENITKSAVVNVNNVQLGRSGFFSSNLTKAEVVQDIQENVKFNLVPRFKDGVVTTLDFMYNENFKNYSPEKYGKASRAFSVKSNNITSSSQIGMDKDVIRAVRLKAQADGESVMSAADHHSKLVGYENQAYPVVAAGNWREAQAFYDEALIMKVSMKMDDGLNEIKSQYLSAGYGESMFILYELYAGEFLNSAQGLNPSITYAGKWQYQQEASNYFWKYNCSILKNQDIANIHINGFNILAGGSEWMDIGNISASLPTQCVQFMGGRAYYVGVDGETDKENVTMFQHKSASAAIALGNLSSNITEGALTGQLKFLMKNNPYKNIALSYIDLGFVHLGISAGALGKAMNYTSRMNGAIRNGLTVEKAAGGEFNIGADLNMLFGDDLQKAKDTEAYKRLTTDYKPFIFNSLADPSISASAETAQQMQNFNEADEDVGDMLVNIIQNQSSLLLNRKMAMGLPSDKSFTQGVAECNANPSVCNKRATGTISDIYSSDPLKLGIGIKIGTTAIAAISKVDIGDIMSKFNISGDSFAGKLMSKLSTAASYVGWLFKLGVFVMEVMVVPIDWFANFLIAIGVWAIGLSVMPAIMLIMMVMRLGVMFISTILIVYSSLFQAALKREPRYVYTGCKLILSEWMGAVFYLVGFAVMLFFIYGVGTGKLERAIYGSIAGDGGFFAMLTGLLVSLFVLAMLHTLCFKIPSQFMDMKNRIFGDSSRILDEDASNKTFETLVFANAGERAGVRILDGLSNSVKGKVGSIVDKWKSKPETPPASGKPATDTEGR